MISAIVKTQSNHWKVYIITVGIILLIGGKKQYIPPKTLVKLLMDVPFLLLGSHTHTHIHTRTHTNIA